MKAPGGTGALAIALLVGVGLGLGVGRALWWPADPTPGSAAREASGAGGETPSALAREIVALREQLAQETRRRERLEVQVAEPEESAPDPGATAGAASGAEDGSEGADPVGEPEAPGRAPWLDGEVLARGGFRESDIEQLRAFYDALELERLYLHDLATREGWIDKPRFRRRSYELNIRAAKLRGEWGDEAYDWILYASGRPNRAVVEAVMESSEAAAVGIEVGDVFLRYEDERIFGVPGLRRATAGGELGRMVSVEVERDGSSIRFFPERGPLGVALRMESKEPSQAAY